MYSGDFTTVRPLDYAPMCGGGAAPSQGTVCLLVGLAAALVLLSSAPSAAAGCHGYLPRLGEHVTAMVGLVGGQGGDVAVVGPEHGAGDPDAREAHADKLRAHVARGPCVVVVFAHWCPHCKGARDASRALAKRNPGARFVLVNAEAVTPEALRELLGKDVEYFPTCAAVGADGTATEAESPDAALALVHTPPPPPQEAEAEVAAKVAFVGEDDDARPDGFLAGLF